MSAAAVETPFVGHVERESVRAVEFVERLDLPCDVEALGLLALEFAAYRVAESFEYDACRRRCVERAEVERFGKLDCRHRSHEPTAGRADIDAQRLDAVGRCEVEDERFDAVAVVVEHGVRQRKRLGHVMSGPCESRCAGVFEKLFQQVVGAVYDERVVLNDVVVHRYLKQKRSFVGVVDYDRNLTPLAGLDSRDLLAELRGDVGAGENAVEVENQRILDVQRFEVGRARFGFEKLLTGLAQRYGRLAGVGQHAGQFGRIIHRDLDILQCADHLFELGRLRL